MKNSELLRASQNALLTSVDQQRRYILRRASTPMACASCGKPVSQIQAFGSGDVDEYPTDSAGNDAYTCPHCGTALQHCLPFIGEPYWMTKAAYDGAKGESNAT